MQYKSAKNFTNQLTLLEVVFLMKPFKQRKLLTVSGDNPCLLENIQIPIIYILYMFTYWRCLNLKFND